MKMELRGHFQFLVSNISREFSFSFSSSDTPTNTFIVLSGGGWAARAYGGRLYMQDNHARKEVGAWCARPRSKNQYLQIDLGEPRTITAVATQGM